MEGGGFQICREGRGSALCHACQVACTSVSSCSISAQAEQRTSPQGSIMEEAEGESQPAYQRDKMNRTSPHRPTPYPYRDEDMANRLAVTILCLVSLTCCLSFVVRLAVIDEQDLFKPGLPVPWRPATAVPWVPEACSSQKQQEAACNIQNQQHAAASNMASSRSGCG